jgi:hypothetical protein
MEFELKPPDAPKEIRIPGDIDVLACDPRRLDEAVAFESKLLKVTPEMFETLQPGKLRGLAKGARQANGQWEFGFHKNYLLICVKIDGRQQGGNFSSRGLTGPLVKVIYDFVGNLPLRPEVGLVVAEITQPIEKDIELAGGIGLKVLRLATPQDQPASLTAWVNTRLGGNQIGY